MLLLGHDKEGFMLYQIPLQHRQWLQGVYLDSLAGSEDELCSAVFSELLQDDELRLLRRDCSFFLEDFRLFSILAMDASQ